MKTYEYQTVLLPYPKNVPGKVIADLRNRKLMDFLNREGARGWRAVTVEGVIGGWNILLEKGRDDGNA